MELMKESQVVINIENSSSMKEKDDEMGNVRKERRMSMSGKKPPRPPCRGFSLDAADQKLIKEISELLIIKRARIQRMNKSKAAAAAASKDSSSSSSTGNLIAMLFTLVFCILIIFQGWQPGSSRGSGPGVAIIVVSPKAEAEALDNFKPIASTK